jgi:hypothetical protein
MNPRKLSKIAGVSYLIIFFAAVFANFLVLEAILQDPMATVQNEGFTIRLGIIAFLITAVFDVVVAWALYELYREHRFSGLSTLFRMMHAAIMATAVFALPEILSATSESEILKQIEIFNTIWLIGLFFFGIHLILLAEIFKRPKFIAFFLLLAGIMYIVDTTAHFLLKNYDQFNSIFLAMVALPSILGEMSLAIWLLVKGGKTS